MNRACRSCAVAKGSQPTFYYWRNKDFLEAGKKQLAGDAIRDATRNEFKDLRSENQEFKEVVAEITLKNRVLETKSDGSWRGGRFVRRTGSEKMEIIRCAAAIFPGCSPSVQRFN